MGEESRRYLRVASVEGNGPIQYNKNAVGARRTHSAPTKTRSTARIFSFSFFFGLLRLRLMQFPAQTGKINKRNEIRSVCYRTLAKPGANFSMHIAIMTP